MHGHAGLQEEANWRDYRWRRFSGHGRADQGNRANVDTYGMSIHMHCEAYAILEGYEAYSEVEIQSNKCIGTMFGAT